MKNNYKNINTINKINKYFVYALFLLCITFFPSTVSASIVFLETKNQTVGINQDFMVDVFINTESESINAIQGSLVLDNDLLTLKSIIDGNSAVNFWIEKPEIKDNKIHFSGISASGFKGNRKFLFSIIINGDKSGKDIIRFSDMEVLKNDGKGTKSIVKEKSISIIVSSKVNTVSQPVSTLNDSEPPEDFIPVISKDPNIFDGKYFLVFATQDKGVGIDHYEIQEGQWSDSVVTKSPYLIKDQSRRDNIFIKAVDKNNNIRMVTIEGENKSEKTTYSFEELLIVAIIFILIISMIIIKKTWKRKTY